MYFPFWAEIRLSPDHSLLMAVTSHDSDPVRLTLDAEFGTDRRATDEDWNTGITVWRSAPDDSPVNCSAESDKLNCGCCGEIKLTCTLPSDHKGHHHCLVQGDNDQPPYIVQWAEGCLNRLTSNHQPQRDDAVATWIKAARDNRHTRKAWNVLDELLNDYRQHADYGRALGSPEPEGWGRG